MNNKIIYLDLNGQTPDIEKINFDLCYHLDISKACEAYNFYIADKQLLDNITSADPDYFQKIRKIVNGLIYYFQFVYEKVAYIETELTDISPNIETLLDLIYTSAVSNRFNVMIPIEDVTDFDELFDKIRLYKSRYKELNFYCKIPLNSDNVKRLHDNEELTNILCSNEYIQPYFYLVDKAMIRKDRQLFIDWVKSNRDIVKKWMFHDLFNSLYIITNDENDCLMAQKKVENQEYFYQDAPISISADIDDLFYEEEQAILQDNIEF